MDRFVHKFDSWRDSLQELVAVDPRVRSAGSVSARERVALEVHIELLAEFTDYREFALTGGELASGAGAGAQAAEAFVRRFSLGFGELSGGYPLMTGRNPVRHEPLVRTPDGRILPVGGANIAWAIRPELEAALDWETAEWHLYEKRRAAYVERQAAALIERALGAPVARNVGFRLPEDDTPREADALVRVEHVCLVVEVKSGELSSKARQNRKREAKDGLGELVGKAAEQAGRLESAIDRGEHVQFCAQQRMSSRAII